MTNNEHVFKAGTDAHVYVLTERLSVRLTSIRLTEDLNELELSQQFATPGTEAVIIWTVENSGLRERAAAAICHPSQLAPNFAALLRLSAKSQDENHCFVRVMSFDEVAEMSDAA